MKKIQSDINNKSFEHLYLLYGPESYQRGKALHSLADAIAAPTDSFNRNTYDGKDIREEDIIEQAETLPFFADRRLIILRDTPFFKAAPDKLIDYLAQLPDYLTLIISEEDADKRSRFFKAVKKYGYVCECARQDERTLAVWIARQLKDKGRRMNDSNILYLIECTGPDMGKISLELDKLTAYTEGREEITRQDIEALVTPEAENRIFDMISAVSSRRKTEALALYADLLSLKEAPMRILILIERQYRQMLFIREMTEEGRSQAEMASVLKLQPFVVRKTSDLVRKMAIPDVRAKLEKAIQAEEDIKTGALPERIALELLITELIKN